MSAVSAFDDEYQGDLRRWFTSALIVLALHGALFAVWINWPDDAPPAGATSPTIVLDIAPVPVSPTDTQLDLSPGPQMQRADAASAPPDKSEARAEQTVEQVPSRPDAEVVLSSQKERQPKPFDAKAEHHKEQPKPEERQQQVDDRKRREAEQKPAPRTAAAPKAKHRAMALASVQSGLEAASVLPSYRDRLAAHLQRYKQYPSAERAAGVQGTPIVSFTISRAGQVLTSRLVRSSGNAALDAETMAMIRRAQPMPSFPPEITVGSMSFTVPIRFSVR
ncbi:MAG: energy transducer TonB [Xanthobacteraceae bacterium]|nr:energy transducer TonB [Xanthobacteraceae bacterium]